LWYSTNIVETRIIGIIKNRSGRREGGSEARVSEKTNEGKNERISAREKLSTRRRRQSRM
jgi:hypothetical protein